ncbi:MAG: cytochrome d ubiquinol oxidase subunit II [Archangium sp.]|nr:cytochrome d ubiquinol oxidase subunit II [Archangium sp.]MDP3153560.1 cytochrome d ubiquinol oxidase subunit II [Archangium sp.]MDP3574517.1 cytochrome d ubiquinol oxidase subunit II [Archangium sp.]
MPEISTVWFWLVALLLTAWAVLDGFDFGAGILHRFVARTDSERREVLGAIGPVFDGNEVWLIAAGGSLYFAFPRLMAAAFSGFYLPMIFVVWALLLRGVSLELRSHVTNSLWRSFFDTTFGVSSFAVPLLMGALLGNLVRGVPLREDGYFELGLFAAGGDLGVLDGYTFLCALLVLTTLAAHGANWLVWKTQGPMHQRVRSLRLPLWLGSCSLWLLTTFVTWRVAPDVIARFPQRPLAWLGLVLVLGGLTTVFLKRKEELAPFAGGVAFIVGCLVMTAACLFPVALRANEAALSLSVASAATGASAMKGALLWAGPGVLLAAGYLWWVLRHFRGKVTAARDGEGY